MTRDGFGLTLFFSMVAVVEWSLQGCGDSGSSKEERVCEPGAVQRCPCAGGLEGVQTCRDDGQGWEKCSSCTGAGNGDADADTDTDGDGDTDTDGDGDTDTDGDGDADADADGDADTDSASPRETDPDAGGEGVADGGQDAGLDECDYVDCEKEVCDASDSCCQGAGCSSWVFSEDDGFIETYCYPLCDATSPDSPCKCGDTCVEVLALPMCLKTSSFESLDLSFPVGPDYANSIIGDGTVVEYEFVLNGEPLVLDMIEFYWEEWTDGDEVSRDMTLLGTKMLSETSFTMMWIAVPEEIFEMGPGTYAVFDDEEDSSPNFFAEVYTGNIDEEGNFEELWLETVIDYESSSLTINRTCAECEGDVATCELCDFSFNIEMFEIRGKVDTNL